MQTQDPGDIPAVEAFSEAARVDWAELVDHRAFAQADETLEQAHQKFRSGNFRYLAVLDGDRALGLCAGRQIGLRLGSQYGFSLFARMPVRNYRLPDPLFIRLGQPVQDVLQQVFSRTGERFNEDVLLVDGKGLFQGLISVQTLVRLQTRLLLHSIRRLREKEEEISRHNRRMTEDLLMAREMQMALLPREPAMSFSGRTSGGGALRILSHYLPLGSVSGDFYEVLALSGTEVSVTIADVMGHGVQAALVTAMMRALIQGHRPLAAAPAEFLTALNRSLCEILEGCRSAVFVSAFTAVADLGDGTLRFANAGHPSPLLLRRGTGSALALDGEARNNGGVLGVDRGAVFHAGRTDLMAGDLVLLFTDGLFEIPGRDGEILGADGLRNLAARLIDQPGDGLAVALVEAARNHSPENRFEDDVCLLGLEIQETPNR